MKAAISLALCGLFIFFPVTAPQPLACTTMIVTKGASADGSVMVSHCEDSYPIDTSIVYVPAQNREPGSLRPVYPSAPDEIIPRIVDPGRAPGYAHPGFTSSVPLGHIPEKGPTYAYLDASYGIVNEHGLMIGECADGSLFSALAEPGARILYTSELSRIALERCRKARDAVNLMGRLIEEYGYYGNGETLVVADGDEAWVMEIAPTPASYGRGGLWVAQQVPDGHFCIVANEFRIREIIPHSSGQLYGGTLALIEKLNIAVRGQAGHIDWMLTVSKGEYTHPYYSLRRVWRGLSLAAPRLGLSPWVAKGTAEAYPFSVPVNSKISFADLRRFHSDHYEGTEFDMTKGTAAGPFGNPNRFLGPRDPLGDVSELSSLAGAWERPLAMYYTSYTTINQLWPDRPAPVNVVSWIALNSPAESVFVPLAVGPVPESYQYHEPRAYDENSAWWTYNLVGEYANLKYSYMIQDIARRAQEYERQGALIVNALADRLGKELIDKRITPEEAGEAFASALRDNAEQVRKSWHRLFFELVLRYNKGYSNSPDKMAQPVGYPQEWLDMTDYKAGPTSYRKQSP